MPDENTDGLGGKEEESGVGGDFDGDRRGREILKQHF